LSSPIRVARGSVFLHLITAGGGGDCRVGIGVVRVVFNLLATLFLGVLSCLALPPEEDTGEDKKRYGCNGHYDSNGDSPFVGQAAGGFICRVDGSGRRLRT